MAERLICWDLDETLGYFRRAEYDFLEALFRKKKWCRKPEWFRKIDPEKLGQVTLTQNIKETLANLQEMGFVHVLTTGALDGYVPYLLERTGLSGFLDRTFTKKDVWDMFGKKYLPVLDAYADRVERENVMIVGNDYSKDRPSDYLDIVMVYEMDCCKKDSLWLLPVFQALIREGPTIRQAFNSLYEKATHNLTGSELDLGEVGIEMDYFGDYRSGRLTPVITNIMPVETLELV